jgi:hypothetical protein
MPPIIGPTTIPAPKAAPMIPMPRARSDGAVTSVTTAWAVPMLAAKNPARIRAT